MSTLNELERLWLHKQIKSPIRDARQFKHALTNDVFLVASDDNSRFIFKRLNQKARSDKDRQLEFLVQQLAAQYGLTPKVLAHDERYKLQQYIAGELISIKSDNLICLLANQLLRIHQLPALHAPKQRLHFELQRLKKQLPVRIDEARFEQMLKLANELDRRSACDTLCHGDLSLNNILQGDDKQIYIIDWEYAVLGCGAYDLAFCNAINQFTKAQAENLIAAYHAQSSSSQLGSLDSLQKECDLYLKIFNYINELWSLCFVENK